MLWTLPQLHKVLKTRPHGIGVANGCFDVIHAGHVDLLKSARAYCETLIVLLNDDDSVRQLKGDGRPVNTLADRAAVLSAIRYVDFVVGFSGEHPADLVQEIRPDVMFKGEDYAGRPVAGAEYAGRLILLPLLPGRSTTAMLEK